MKTLQDFKNEVAKENDYISYDDYYICPKVKDNTWEFHSRLLDEAAERYAHYCFEQGAKAQRLLCAEAAKIKPMYSTSIPFVDKDSILNAPLAKMEK